MTTLAIMATYEKKRLKCYGTVAAGEHVAVTVTDGAQWIGEGKALRLRVLFGPNTVAVFPFADGDAWTATGTQNADAYCELNLNTLQAEKYLKCGGPCLWILDDVENHTLYATGEFEVLPWPKRRGIDEPIDLDGYPLLLDEIKDLKEAFEEYQRTVAQMLATKQNTIFDLATIRGGAAAGATAVQPSQIARFVDDAEYKAQYGEQNKPAILFKHGTNVIVALDATPFVRDGVVSDVKIVGGNLVITFNTDSGKQPISIPLTDIFNPDNYYDKIATDNKLAGKADKVANATSGNLAGLDENGNLTDSGKKPADFAGAVHAHTASQITDLGSQLAPKVARTELFPAWAANTLYTTYSLVIHENAVYKCTEAHTSGAEWDSTKWAVATGAEVLGVLLNYLALSNKPQINNVTLTGESSQSGDSLGLVDKTGDQTIGGSKVFTGLVGFYDLTISHPQGQGYIRIYASANVNRVHIEFSDAVSGSQGELFLPVLGGYSAVTLAAIENLAPDAFLMLYDGATVDLNTLCCYQGRLYRCVLGYTFQSGDSYPPDDPTHWTPATVEDVLAALRTALQDKANASDLPYAISESIPLTVTSGAASTTLDDRTHNVRTVAAPGSGNTTTITATLPAIVQGKSRDMFLNLTVGSAASDAGDISLSIVEPSGATVQIEIGSVEDIGIGKNEILISENALPTTSGNVTTTHWLVTVRHEDFAS